MFENRDDIFYIGPELDGLKCCVLNSRQSKIILGNDPWVLVTKMAVEYGIAQNFIFLASIGMSTHEIALTHIAKSNGKAIIVLPLRNDENPWEIIDRISEDFNLKSDLSGFLFFADNGPKNKPKSWWPCRDKLLIDLADWVFPISIRENGNLARLMKTSRTDPLFQMEYSLPDRSNTLKYNPASIRKFENWNYIVHWTHSQLVPNEGENRAEFYRQIIYSKDDYAKTAKKSLMKIIAERCIYGSSHLYRNSVTAVAFSENAPNEMVEIIRYRSRFNRLNYELYGIGIDKDYAAEVGIRKVIYGDKSIFDQLGENDQKYFQSEGKDGIWRKENEWRYLGDFNFSSIPSSRIVILVPTEDDKIHFKQKSPYEIINITN